MPWRCCLLNSPPRPTSPVTRLASEETTEPGRQLRLACLLYLSRQFRRRLGRAARAAGSHTAPQRWPPRRMSGRLPLGGRSAQVLGWAMAVATPPRFRTTGRPPPVGFRIGEPHLETESWHFGKCRYRLLAQVRAHGLDGLLRSRQVPPDDDSVHRGFPFSWGKRGCKGGHGWPGAGGVSSITGSLFWSWPAGGLTGAELSPERPRFHQRLCCAGG